jgi:hypothetical protein
VRNRWRSAASWSRRARKSPSTRPRAYTAFGKTSALEAGKLLYLPTGEPYSVKGVEDASLLLTILRPKH